MEIDIDICLNNVARDEASSLAKQFLVERTNKDAGGELQDIVIRQEADNRTGIVDHIVGYIQWFVFLPYLIRKISSIRKQF